MARERDYAWLLSSRARIQHSLLTLYQVLTSRRAELESDSRNRALFTMLLGAAFSLWRAAFLEDVTHDVSKVFRGAEVFLTKVIGDNAINYPQDRETRDWVGGYYLNSARYRLIRLRDKLDLAPDDHTELLDLLREIDSTGWLEATAPTKAWDALHGALVAFLEMLDTHGTRNRAQPSM